MVYEVLQLHWDYGQVNNLFACNRGHLYILDNGDVEYIYAVLQANSALYLDELQEQLFSVWDKNVFFVTISHTIWQLAMSHKHILKTALEINELLWATWQAERVWIYLGYFVWLDESSVDDHWQDQPEEPGMGRSWTCLCTELHLFRGSTTLSSLHSLQMVSLHLTSSSEQRSVHPIFEWGIST